MNKKSVNAEDGQYSRMSVINMDSPSYLSKNPKKFLETAEKVKKRNYLDPCVKHCRHFTPFVASVYGLLGVEAEATLNRIASRHTTKWKEPYSCNC